MKEYRLIYTYYNLDKEVGSRIFSKFFNNLIEIKEFINTIPKTWIKHRRVLSNNFTVESYTCELYGIVTSKTGKILSINKL